MQPFIEYFVLAAVLVVPLLALWAIAGLYSTRAGSPCHVTQVFYLATLLMIAGLTVRTVMANDSCWLIHTASLGIMIVFGVMRRPLGDADWDLQLH
ncbi:MAG: hypothetical protein R3C53_13480 [Pirellulaceae bacterium]